MKSRVLVGVVAYMAFAGSAYAASGVGVGRYPRYHRHGTKGITGTGTKGITGTGTKGITGTVQRHHWTGTKGITGTGTNNITIIKSLNATGAC